MSSEPLSLDSDGFRMLLTQLANQSAQPAQSLTKQQPASNVPSVSLLNQDQPGTSPQGLSSTWSTTPSQQLMGYSGGTSSTRSTVSQPSASPSSTLPTGSSFESINSYASHDYSPVNMTNYADLNKEQEEVRRNFQMQLERVSGLVSRPDQASTLQGANTPGYLGDALASGNNRTPQLGNISENQRGVDPVLQFLAMLQCEGMNVDGQGGMNSMNSLGSMSSMNPLGSMNSMNDMKTAHNALKMSQSKSFDLSATSATAGPFPVNRMGMTSSKSFDYPAQQGVPEGIRVLPNMQRFTQQSTDMEPLSQQGRRLGSAPVKPEKPGKKGREKNWVPQKAPTTSQKNLHQNLLRAKSVEELVSLIVSATKSDMNALIVCTAFNKLTKIHAGHSDMLALILRFLTVRIQDFSDELNARMVSNIFHAFAQFGINDPQVVVPLQNRACAPAVISVYKAQEIACLLWALAKISLLPSSTGLPGLAYSMDILAQRAIEPTILSNFTAQNIANTVWALAKMNINNPQVWSKLAEQAEEIWETFNAQDVSNTVWAFTKQDISAPSLIYKLASRAMHPDVIQDFNVWNVHNVIWGVSKVQGRTQLHEQQGPTP